MNDKLFNKILVCTVQFGLYRYGVLETERISSLIISAVADFFQSNKDSCQRWSVKILWLAYAANLKNLEVGISTVDRIVKQRIGWAIIGNYRVCKALIRLILWDISKSFKIYDSIPHKRSFLF
jgi:hypothetical protein